MVKQQQQRYQVFLKVRDFGARHQDQFPATSPAGRAFANVAEAAATIERQSSDRLVQATAMMTSMQNVNIPSILAGDFNCTPGSEPLNVVEAHFTRVTDDAPSIPVVAPKSKIDHIFVHPATRWRVLETHVIDEEMASDHRPVVAKIELLPDGE